jgi:hypothetical protein
MTRHDTTHGQGDRVAELPTALVKQRKKERYARSNDLLQAVKKHLDASHKLKFSIDQLYVIRYTTRHDTHTHRVMTLTTTRTATRHDTTRTTTLIRWW